ncbi:hypothetical protein PLESTB_001580600 [Pleodorina starrii]|uniref:t-SNARE coiled-coil homology domain-containing protein n=1 Tax=Pleodorina starrii TaxID=330485 RepID=A0A9W6F8A7_9CHLO|nr:hypothetical protein PLESTM_000724500 [Pleodorina starrii]GLC60162.1 hypothetical protein PLESTB_001580600 [Pleodorina starrii]GLC66952.1 hypothetical protein PLESTF_000495400 [Pleodorina starrii]
MSIYDLIQRTDIILQKYAKYDPETPTKGKKKKNTFAELYQEIEAEVEKLMEIKDLIERIYAVPDGLSFSTNRRPTARASSSRRGKKGDPIHINGDLLQQPAHPANQAGYFSHTEATQRFEREWDERRARQDEQLEQIGHTVEELGDIARNLGGELDRQAPVIDDIERQLDRVTRSLKSNNAKLHGLVTRVRSSRNFCVDAILIAVLLAIGAYIYAMFM